MNAGAGTGATAGFALLSAKRGVVTISERRRQRKGMVGLTITRAHRF